MEHEETRTAPAPTAHALISPELRNQLAQIARNNDRSLAAEVRRAIAEHVEREATAATPDRAGV